MRPSASGSSATAPTRCARTCAARSAGASPPSTVGSRSPRASSAASTRRPVARRYRGSPPRGRPARSPPSPREAPKRVQVLELFGPLKGPSLLPFCPPKSHKSCTLLGGQKGGGFLTFAPQKKPLYIDLLWGDGRKARVGTGRPTRAPAPWGLGRERGIVLPLACLDDWRSLPPARMPTRLRRAEGVAILLTC